MPQGDNETTERQRDPSTADDQTESAVPTTPSDESGADRDENDGTPILSLADRHEIMQECEALVIYLARHGDALQEGDKLEGPYKQLSCLVSQCHGRTPRSEDWPKLMHAYANVTRFTYGQRSVNGRSVLDTWGERDQPSRSWRALEDLTGAWAQAYGKVWVMQGPVFGKKAAPFFIGDAGERTVAVPDALYKIVVREKTPEEKDQSRSAEKDDPEVLVFLYPQLGPGYYGPKKEYQHERFLTALGEIETLTGMTFFPTLDKAIQRRLRRTRAEHLWPVTLPPDQPELERFVTGCPQ